MAIPPRANFDNFLSYIESPALRAIAQRWNEARGARQMPAWADLNSPTLSPYFKMLWAFQYYPDAEEFRGWFAGAKLNKWIDKSFSGGRLQDLAPHTSYENIRERLTKLISGPSYLRTSGRIFIVDGLNITGERIALPMSGDGKLVDGVFGASDYVSPPLLGSAELVYENEEWYNC